VRPKASLTMFSTPETSVHDYTCWIKTVKSVR